MVFCYLINCVVMLSFKYAGCNLKWEGNSCTDMYFYVGLKDDVHSVLRIGSAHNKAGSPDIKII